MSYDVYPGLREAMKCFQMGGACDVRAESESKVKLFMSKSARASCSSISCYLSMVVYIAIVRPKCVHFLWEESVRHRVHAHGR